MRPRYVLLPEFARLTGYSVRALREKIYGGIWREGREYRKAPDGRLLIDLKGFESWVENQRAS